MWQSLLLKLGMFAATMGVVFWIGWTLPTSFDRPRDLATDTQPRVLVHDVEDPERPAIARHAGHEVVRPHVVRMSSRPVPGRVQSRPSRLLS